MVVIAISGKSVAGTATIGKKLAKDLGLEYFDAGAYYKQHSSKTKEVEQALELLRSKNGTSEGFHKHIDKLQREMAKKDNIVICGKLALHMLKDIADIKIWIECSFEERVRRVSKRDKIAYVEARQKLKEKEEREREMWKKIYGIDYFYQSNIADILIDTTNLTEEETLAKIKNEVMKLRPDISTS